MRVHGKRFMLNPPGVQSTAAIVAEVEDSSGWRPGKDGQGRDFDLSELWTLEPVVMLKVSDCDRAATLAIQFATLAIQFATPYLRRAALVKVDRMIEALTAFREGLVKEQKLYAERVRTVKRQAASRAVDVAKS